MEFTNLPKEIQTLILSKNIQHNFNNLVCVSLYINQLVMFYTRDIRKKLWMINDRITMYTLSTNEKMKRDHLLQRLRHYDIISSNYQIKMKSKIMVCLDRSYDKDDIFRRCDNCNHYIKLSNEVARYPLYLEMEKNEKHIKYICCSKLCLDNKL